MSNLLERTILALDNMSEEEIQNFLKIHESQIPTLKIGLELFCKHGPDVVRRIQHSHGKNIFLDLKLHDIPNTVFKSVKSLSGLPIEFLTIHLSGGEEMIRQALEAAKEYLPNTKLLGVSYLTSLGNSDFDQNWGINEASIEDQFKRLFTLAAKTRIHGIVCSPHEAKVLKSISSEVITVCPGIRFQDEIDAGNTQDQKRVLSPHDAMKSGTDYMVIGRSLTKSDRFAERINYLESIQYS